jgi:hypothetical protein
MTTSERVSLVTSVVAVVISLLATYFQFFWSDQDLRLQWYPGDTGFPSLKIIRAAPSTNNGSITVKMSPAFVLVNSGNLPASLAEIRLTLLYSGGASPTNVWTHGTTPPLSACYDEKYGGSNVSWETLTLDGEERRARPITIRPGDIVSFRTTFRELSEMTDSSWRYDSEVTTCFSFELVDSNGERTTKRIPAFQFGTTGGRSEDRSGPVQLLE